jgi:hypothetical protein
VLVAFEGDQICMPPITLRCGNSSMITFNAHFDGDHLCPDEPVALPRNVTLRVTVVENAANSPDELAVGDPKQAAAPRGLFGSLMDDVGLVEGPADWSAELDHYLYGTPKRGDGPAA